MKKLFLLIAGLLVVAAVKAQEVAGEDLYSMDLEQLLSLKLKRLSLTDIPHTHARGELMISLKTMNMFMAGSRNGTQSLSDAEVLDDYMVTPTEMTMQMHMLGVMYSPVNRVTLMGMMNFNQNSMDHLTRMGMAFNTEASGLGDTRLSALFDLIKRNSSKLILTTGVSLPTASIDSRDNTPASGESEVRLPYPMQLGSGTVDPVVALTYFSAREQSAWGFDARGTYRLGENENEYTLGNAYAVSGWYARELFPFLITTLRLEGKGAGNIDGADPELNPMMVYTADPNLRAGFQTNVGLGLNFVPEINSFKGLRFNVEGKLPVYRNLEGPQLETDFILGAGVSLTLNTRK